jgi:hypothetical protein
MSTEYRKEIPAISIRQPWAELILLGKKTIEIRKWNTTFRGTLYLHTGKKPDGYRILDLGMQDAFRGGYVGTIDVSSIVPLTPRLWEHWRDLHLSNGQFRNGLYGWIITHPRRFITPIPGPGSLRIFYPEADIAEILDNARNNLKI